MKGNKFFKSSVAGLALTSLAQGASNNTVNAAWYDFIIFCLKKLDFFGWFSSSEKSSSEDDNSEKLENQKKKINPYSLDSEKKTTKITNEVLPKEGINTNSKKHEIKGNENSNNIDNKPNDNNPKKELERRNDKGTVESNVPAKTDTMPQNRQEEEVYPKNKEDCRKLLKEKESELGMAKSNLARFKKYKDDIDRFSGWLQYKKVKNSNARKVALSLMLGEGEKEFEKQKADVIDNCNDFLKGFLKEYCDESEEDVNRYIKKLKEGTLLKIAEDGDVGLERYLKYTELYFHVENFWACTFLYVYSECDSAESIEKKFEEELETLEKDIENLKKIINSSDKEKSDANLSKNFPLPENLDNN